jgi:hypothetical protein
MIARQETSRRHTVKAAIRCNLDCRSAGQVQQPDGTVTPNPYLAYLLHCRTHGAPL